MTYTHTSGPGPYVPTQQASWRRLPISLWIGLGAGLLGFFLELSASSTSTRNGEVTSCWHVDLGPWVVVATIAVCLLIGLIGTRNRHVAQRAGRTPLAGVTVALTVLCFVHVARGLGVFGGGPC